MVDRTDLSLTDDQDSRQTLSDTEVLAILERAAAELQRRGWSLRISNGAARKIVAEQRIRLTQKPQG